MPRLNAKFLTDAAIQRMKAAEPDKRRQIFDTQVSGLALRITDRGAKSFAFVKRISGHWSRITIGSYPTVSLAEARQRAHELSESIARGEDPRVTTRAEKAKEQNLRLPETYEEVVEEFIQKYAVGKKENRQWKESRRLLLTAGRDWKGRELTSITRRDVHNVLDGIMAQGKGYAANRTLAALRTYFRWCATRDMLTKNPIEGVERPFDGEKPRERAWSDEEIRALWRAAGDLDEIRGAYLKVLILMGQRRGEVAEMTRDQLEEDGTLWRLPAARAKGKREHVFPLPKLAQRIISAVPQLSDCSLIFPTNRLKPMNAWSTFKVILRNSSSVEDFQFHQARHTLRTGLDRLGVPPHVKDECLNHARQGVGGKHYSHYNYHDEQRQAFEAWASHIEKLVHGENVVMLGR